MKIEHNGWMICRAALARSFMGVAALQAPDDPNRIGYNEFKRKVFDCEFGDGDGETPETAITIQGANKETIGITAEYLYLAWKFGLRDMDWSLKMQAKGESNGRDWDMMTVKLKDGTEKTLYFDITAFLGKW